MDKMIYFKIQIEPYFAFIFFTPNESTWWVFKLTSLFSLLDEKMNMMGELKAYLVYLYVYRHQANDTLISRLDKRRNIPPINQYLTSYKKTGNDTNMDYNKVIQFELARKQRTTADTKQQYKQIEEIIGSMKSVLERSIADLKNEKHLDSFKKWEGVEEDIALCGLVQKNGVKLAIVSQRNDSTKAIYLSPKQLLALIDDVSKPIIVQAHKEADRAQNQQAASQIIAYFDTNKGSLEIKEGLQGRVIASKDDIIDQRSYNIDIDVLLAYYNIFSYEQISKEAFEKLLYKSEIYSSFEIK
jgi:hypothetical protein